MTEQTHVPRRPSATKRNRRLRRVSKLSMISCGLFCPYLTIHQDWNQDLAILAEPLNTSLQVPYSSRRDICRFYSYINYKSSLMFLQIQSLVIANICHCQILSLPKSSKMTMTNIGDWKNLAIILPNSVREKNLVKDYCQILAIGKVQLYFCQIVLIR